MLYTTMDYNSIENKITKVVFHPVAFIIYGIIAILLPFFIFGWSQNAVFSSNNLLYSIICMASGGATILMVLFSKGKDYFTKN